MCTFKEKHEQVKSFRMENESVSRARSLDSCESTKRLRQRTLVFDLTPITKLRRKILFAGCLAHDDRMIYISCMLTVKWAWAYFPPYFSPLLMQNRGYFSHKGEFSNKKAVVMVILFA
ncbi:hypothetical protein Zmor_020969 [Zophobas morio]|uniref:Uncharacterized protein n=1 Tax=Zophobas morio TaxID=2755281 RepID=A0AA38I4Z9_9CUCU|nr:hypothetical protein Zmor_020969 [Zophobas morio]